MRGSELYFFQGTGSLLFHVTLGYLIIKCLLPYFDITITHHIPWHESGSSGCSWMVCSSLYKHSSWSCLFHQYTKYPSWEHSSLVPTFGHSDQAMALNKEKIQDWYSKCKQPSYYSVIKTNISSASINEWGTALAARNITAWLMPILILDM